MDGNELYREYQYLLNIRAQTGFKEAVIDFVTNTLSSDRHLVQYKKLKQLCRENQDALLQLMIDDSIPVIAKVEFLGIATNSASLNRDLNADWWDFSNRLRQHLDQLPEHIVVVLNWRLKVHNW